MIDDYLAELLAHLRLPDGKRRRIVAEVEDHLACAAADLHTEGLDPEQAEREAVLRFGPSDALARTFLEHEAARAGRRAGWAGATLAFVTAVLMIGAPGSAVFRGDFPLGVLAFVLGQVALIAGALTLARAWVGSTEGGLRGPRLTLVLRGTLVVLGCALIGLLFGAARSLASGHWRATHWLPLAALMLASAPTLEAHLRARCHAQALGVPARPGADLSELLALALDRIAAPRAVALASFPRRHPWRFAAGVSIVAGVALAVGHGLSEGGVPVHHVLRALDAGAIIACVEALAALLGFAVLGRYLGLRSDIR